MVWLVVLILLVVLDQLSKLWVVANLSGGQAITVIDGFFYLVHRRNTGAAWSFLADADWGVTVLAILSAIASLAILVILLRMEKFTYQLSLTLMGGGAIGNLIDRIRLRSVTDFLDFHFGSYIFPTFNLADIFLVVGTILLSLMILTDPPADLSIRNKQTYLS